MTGRVVHWLLRNSDSSLEGASTDLSTPPGIIVREANGASLGGGWTQFLFVIFLNLAMIAINCFFADLLPPVTPDEVMFTDPAVNLAWGHGFRSSAWFTQSYDTIFAGNAPLYSLLLSVWITLFGFNITIVRLFNYIIMGLTITVLWHNLRQTTHIRNRHTLTFFILLLWLGEGIALSYRMGRYDALGIFVLALTWSASLIGKESLRYALLFILGVAIPVTGYHLVPYVLMTGVVLLLIRLRGGLRSFMAITFGMGAGLLAIILTYRQLGALDVLAKSIMHHSHVSTLLSYRFGTLVRAIRFDMSSLCLLAALILLASKRMRAQGVRACKLEMVGLFYLLVVPTAYSVLRIAQDYYAWMKYIPAAVCLALSLDQLSAGSSRSRVFRLALFMGLVAMMGFPARLMLAARDAEGFRHDRLAEFVQRNVRSGDSALISYEAYYPTKRIAEQVYLTGYQPAMTAEEKARISVLIANPKDENTLLAAVGGQWTCTATYDPMRLFTGGSRRMFGWPPYQLRVFRKQ